MPELPEVEVFANAITKICAGKQIAKVYFRRDSIRYTLDKKGLEKVFSNKTVITKCSRIGKQLLLETQNGAVNISLGMTGSFKEADVHAPEKHEHITLLFCDKTALGYIDPRRFGDWAVHDKNKPYTAVDPLNTKALLDLFKSIKVTKSSRSVKDILMDQKLIGGIGNIYALEALFISGIHPLKTGDKLTKKEWANLAGCIPQLLAKAIELKGSSVVSYRTLDGSKGSFQKLHRVYDKAGKNCTTPGCLALISQIKQGGRSSWFCERCQKL